MYRVFKQAFKNIKVYVTPDTKVKITKGTGNLTKFSG